MRPSSACFLHRSLQLGEHQPDAARGQFVVEPQERDREPVLFQEVAVGAPGGVERFVRVMEEIDVTGDPVGPRQLRQRYAAGDIALTGSDAVIGYEAADGALEVCESHRRISRARR